MTITARGAGNRPYMPQTMSNIVSILAGMKERSEFAFTVPAPNNDELVSCAKQVQDLLPPWAYFPSVVAVHYVAVQEAGRAAADAWHGELVAEAHRLKEEYVSRGGSVRDPRELVPVHANKDPDARRRAALAQALASWRAWWAAHRVLN